MRCTKLKALDLSLNSMREGAGLLSQDNLKLLLQAGVYTPIGWPQIVLPAVKNVRGHIEGMFIFDPKRPHRRHVCGKWPPPWKAYLPTDAVGTLHKFRV